MGNLVLLDAPSNLGLRPPAEGVVPGCYKAPGALRDLGLLTRLGAAEGGVVTAARYHPDWTPGAGVRNKAAIAGYTRKLADRVGEIRADGGFPVVLGGDCSIALGSALALRREGRFGLVYLDGHDDFRHLGNAEHVGSVAGEALAVVTGRGEPEVADAEGLSPYVRDEDVLVLGVREDESADARAADLHTVTSQQLMDHGVGDALALARELFGRPGVDGFWIHCDVDTLDPAFVSAVDSPDPGGLDPETLVALFRGLLAIPGAAGLELTVFDPDLDPTGSQATLVADVLVRSFTTS